MSDSTAAGVAKARHLESLALESARIVDDPYAQYFYTGATLVSLMGHRAGVWLFDWMMPGIYDMLIARTKTIDKLLRAEAPSVQQVVILGAGYDMRGFRLHHEGLQIFEVDQPAVQARKKAKVAQIPNLPSASVHYVPVDFSCQLVDEELRKVPSFDPKAASLIILEGVTQYIPREAVASTIKAMDSISGEGSTFFMSYVDEQVQTPEKVVGAGYANPQKLQQIISYAAKLGEPWINFYAQSEIPQVFCSCSNFRLVSDISTEDISKKWFPPERQVPSEKLLLLERYVVAKK